MIPLHPQHVPGRPDRLRWVVPVGALPCTGRLGRVPAPLAALLADGTLASVTAEPGAVVTTLGRDRSWPGEGARVRTALHAALDDRAGWAPAPAPAADDGAGDGAGDGDADDHRADRHRADDHRADRHRADDHRADRHRADDHRADDDARLYRVASDLLAGAVGRFALSHGGVIELVGVREGVVTVRLAGACRGCPAARITLHQRLERHLRRQCPDLVAVRDAGTRGI
ncbi:NifU family protein [Streptomyces sp. NPDC007264]|uniref:NifU family protein n=1 Tax=Streptomyces sp. NPDC007264 TaxID=3364777 RepID=UPI0036DB0F8C